MDMVCLFIFRHSYIQAIRGLLKRLTTLIIQTFLYPRGSQSKCLKDLGVACQEENRPIQLQGAFSKWKKLKVATWFDLNK